MTLTEFLKAGASIDIIEDVDCAIMPLEVEVISKGGGYLVWHFEDYGSTSELLSRLGSSTLNGKVAAWDGGSRRCDKEIRVFVDEDK